MPAPKSTLGIISPVQDQNYVLNPSAETTGNFSNQAGGVVTRVTTFQKYGLYSYQVATTAAADGGNFTLLALPNSANYVTFRVKSNVRLNITIGSATREAAFLEKIDSQWRLFGATFTASETSGQANLRITQIGSGANTFYLDGLQVSPVIEGRYYTTYIDGTQEGSRWLGAPHASASMRSGQSRAGGVVRDFYRDYGFVVERIIGGGSVKEELSIDSYAMLPGGELNNDKTQIREFSLVGYFLADSGESLHENIQRLELELGLNTYPSQQPFRLRFSGARVLKEISARYAGGLEGDLPIYYDDCLSVEDEKWVQNRFWRTRAAVQMVAEDPFWYEVGESAALLDTNDTATFRMVAARLGTTGQWSALGPPGAGGTYTEIWAFEEDETYIYIGGDFLNWDGIAAADYIVRYNKQTGVYSALGTGVNQEVRALALGPDGRLYAGGSFTTAGGSAALRLAVWNGTSWSQVGVGIGQTVFTLAFGLDGILYIGGLFSTLGDASAANFIAYWDGTTLAELGASGLNSWVLGLGVGIDGKLYIGGIFDDEGTGPGNTLNNVTYWDGSSFNPMGVGTSGDVRALAISSSGLVYVGGEFSTAGGVTVGGIALWNGSAWTALGTGVSGGDVSSLSIGPDGVLYAGGDFSGAGGLTLNDKVSRWNGYSWAHLDIDLPGAASVLAILISKYDIDPVVPQNYTIYLGFNTTGTGAFSDDETASNEGSASAFPRLIFTRSGGTGATLQSIRNERTGLTLLCDYTLLDGETVIIDLYPKDRSETSSFFGDVAIVLPNSNMSQWNLLPGSNQISAFVSESGSPTITGWLLWRDAYRSYN